MEFAISQLPSHPNLVAREWTESQLESNATPLTLNSTIFFREICNNRLNLSEILLPRPRDYFILIILVGKTEAQSVTLLLKWNKE